MTTRVGPFVVNNPPELRRQLDALERKVDQLQRELASKGSAGAVQYNDGNGQPSGATRVEVSDNDLLLLPATRFTTPTDGAKIGARTIAGREWPMLVHSGGVAVELESMLAGSDFTAILGMVNATTFTSLGATPTNVGTATARAKAAAGTAQRWRRTALVSAAGAGSLASQRVAQAQQSVGDGAGLGGFYYRCQFAASDAAAVAGARMFVGVSSSTGAATNVEPSTLTNCAGVAQLSTDATQLYLVFGGSAAQPVIPLGTSFPPYIGAVGVNNGSLIRLELWSPPNEVAVIYYRVQNLNNGAETSGKLTGTVGTMVPATTTMLTTQTWRTNNATALAVGIDICETWLRNP